MERNLESILQEIEVSAQELEDRDYIREASDLRSLVDSLKTGVPLRSHKIVQTVDK